MEYALPVRLIFCKPTLQLASQTSTSSRVPYSILSISQKIRPSGHICVSGCGDQLKERTLLCRPICQADEALDCLLMSYTYHFQLVSAQICSLVPLPPPSVAIDHFPTEIVVALTNELCVPADRPAARQRTYCTTEKCKS